MITRSSSKFTFLPPAFKELADASRKAEAQIMGDPPAALQHRALCGEL